MNEKKFLRISGVAIEYFILAGAYMALYAILFRGAWWQIYWLIVAVISWGMMHYDNYPGRRSALELLAEFFLIIRKRDGQRSFLWWSPMAYAVLIVAAVISGLAAGFMEAWGAIGDTLRASEINLPKSKR